MEILVRNVAEETIKAGALVLTLFENEPADIYAGLDLIIGKMIKMVIDSGEFSGKQNQLTLLHVRNINAGRILLTGLGKRQDFTSEKIRQAGGKAFSYLREIGISDVAVSNKTFVSAQKDLSASMKPVYYFMEGALLGLYKFEKYKKTQSREKNFKDNSKQIKTAVILDEDKSLPLNYLQTVIAASSLAKDLVNTPANDMTPGSLSAVAKAMSGKKLKVRVLDRKEAEKEGMWSYLSVAKGSVEPPKFIVMEYSGGKGAPIVLIGKSITFDSGGISLKPADGMEKMKYDMAGGAAVAGIMHAVMELGLKLNIVGILPATENLPGGNATRPGDIVTSITGKTIEIQNTDAEGRLVLADAIGYAIKYYKPKAVIDIATLTGACSVALGNEAIAMMGNNTELMNKFKKASVETYERVWEMPLYEEYKDYLKSDVADIRNVGGRNGSLVTAGYFLKEFAGDTPWVHLDIASTAFNDKDKPYLSKGATGIGVRLVLDFLKEF